MSVFTPLTDPQIDALLTPFGLRLIDARVATEGISNSNYLLHCQRTDGAPVGTVLTVFEAQTAQQLGWYAALLGQLAEVGLPVPAPLSAQGQSLFEVAGKPAMLAPWLPGSHAEHPSAAQCRAIGALLGQLHRLPIPSTPAPERERDKLPGLAATLTELAPALQQAARDTLARWQQYRLDPVLCHADLFRDNALFEGDTLTGVLDFYHACDEVSAYELAVVINDWCLDADGDVDAARVDGLLAGYRQHRPLTAEVLAALPLATTLAALRFYMSRRQAAQQQREAEGQGSKDPAPMLALFQRRYQQLIDRDR